MVCTVQVVRPEPVVIVTEPDKKIRPILPAGYGSGFETGRWRSGFEAGGWSRAGLNFKLI